MRVRLISPRIFSSLMRSPALTVLPAPGSSASRNPRESEEIVVDGFELVGKGIYAGNRQSKVGVIFVSEAQPKRLDSKSKLLGIAVEQGLLGGRFLVDHLTGVADRLVD